MCVGLFVGILSNIKACKLYTAHFKIFVFLLVYIYNKVFTSGSCQAKCLELKVLAGCFTAANILSFSKLSIVVK